VYKNGVDILIRAVAELKRKDIRCPLDIECPRIELLILGSGPEEQNLKKLAKNLDLSNEVIFLGHINPDEIPQYLVQADIFVRPSRSEGLGNSFLEAMAAGLPVIGTAVGGIPDFLKDGETGLFAKVEDYKDLAEKIIRVLNDTGLSRKLSENGKKLVESKYSWDFIAQDMNRILVKILKPNSLTSSPKKLLLATGIYPPDIGGPATYAVLLKKELPKKGIDVEIVTYGPAGISRSIPKGLRHFIFFFKCLVVAFKSDVILTQDTISAGLPALFASRLSGRKFIIRVPGDYVWEQSVQRFGVKDSIDDFQNKKYGFRVEFLRSIQKFVVRNADIVITPSKYFGNLVSKWVKDPSKIHVIYNGINLENPKSQIPNPKQIPNSKFQITKNKTIVSVGRLVPWKGFGFLIELMKDLPDWKLVIIGDGPEMKNLQLLIANYQLQNRVELTGAVSREKVLEYLSNAKIFILNTSFESFSFQVVEAMSLGIPVITTNIGNLSEIIENGVDGILLEPNNKEQFLNAINKLDSDENFRNGISQRAKIKAEKFSIENTMNELVKVL
ncbi:MAG: glycosyltransferase family 4 protein, partial [Patescibacteria group bacterium]